MNQYNKFLFAILFLSLSTFNVLYAESFSYHREYDDYKPGIFKYYFGIDISRSHFNYKSKDSMYEFGNDLWAEKFLIGTKIENMLGIEIFYKKSPYHKGSLINAPSSYNLLNSFYSFGFELLPQIGINKYFDLLFSSGITKHEIRSISFNKVVKSNGNGFKFGVGFSAHLNNSVDLRILYNRVIFTGYDAMSSNAYPSLSLVINL